MKVDEQTVFMVGRITVRCNECVRQVHVYLSTGALGLDEMLLNVGWTCGGVDEHYCPEHS
jgi:hypothetical protein